MKGELWNRLLGGGENVFKTIDLSYKNCFNKGAYKLSDIYFAGLTTVWVNKTRSILSSSLFMLVLWQRMP